MPPWTADAVTIAFGAFIVGCFVALLCQTSLPGGAAVIALMTTAAYLARSPR